MYAYIKTLAGPRKFWEFGGVVDRAIGLPPTELLAAIPSTALHCILHCIDLICVVFKAIPHPIFPGLEQRDTD